MASPWIDISVPLRTGMVHWPGDPPTAVTRVQDLTRDDICTVSRIDMCAHAGTHMDAPAHFIQGGKTIDRMPMDIGVGPARVIAIQDSQSITAQELAGHRIRRGERLLFKTRNSDRFWKTGTFSPDFVSITPEAAGYLAKQQVRLVGVDSLSVGSAQADGVETHRILLEAGIWIIEGLNLSKVEPGPAQLICLPLKLMGAEGAPARAILRQVKRRGRSTR